MAGSRMEKLSNIFKRYSGLIRSGAVLEESRPVWYDVYGKFPPTTEPLAIRATPQTDVQQIFYPEDVLRSRVQRQYDTSSILYNFVDAQQKPNSCEVFIDKYLQLASANGQEVSLNDDQIFTQTEKVLKDELGFDLKPKHVRKPQVNFIGKTFESSQQ